MADSNTYKNANGKIVISKCDEWIAEVEEKPRIKV